MATVIQIPDHGFKLEKPIDEDNTIQRKETADQVIDAEARRAKADLAAEKLKSKRLRNDLLKLSDSQSRIDRANETNAALQVGGCVSVTKLGVLCSRWSAPCVVFSLDVMMSMCDRVVGG